MKHIQLCIPSYDGKVPCGLMQMFLGQTAKDWKMGFTYTDGMWISPARNGMAKNAIEIGADYVLFCDSDQIVELDTVNKLLSLDKDIVCSVIPDRNGEDGLCMHNMDAERVTEVTEDMEVLWCGMGCTLIKTEVIKAVFDNPDMSDPFDVNQIEWGDEVLNLGEDYAFCQRARALGYEVWAKHDSNPVHLGKPVQYKYNPQENVIIQDTQTMAHGSG